VHVDDDHVVAVEAERADQRVAAVVEGVALDQLQAAGDEGDPVGIVDEGVADVAARLAAGRILRARVDLGEDVMRRRIERPR
jgi:hypothetical protein